MNSTYRYIAICVLSTLGLNSLAADVPKARAEELFPDTTFAALIIPDLSAARAAAGKTRLADMYAQPDMQAFLAPPIAQLKSVYNDLRTKNALLPVLEDLDAGFFSGEFAEAAYVRPGDRKTPVGLVLTLAPKDPEAFRRLLPMNVRDLLTEGQVIPVEELGIAYLGGRVVVCFPQADIGQILSRLKDPASRSKNSLSANASFTALNTHLAGSAAFLYLSPPKLLDALMTDPDFRSEANPAAIQSMLKATGISNLSSAGFSLGFSATDPICEAFLGFNAPPKDDLFALFNSSTPITPEGLKIAAPESPYVAGMFVNFSRVIPFIRTLADGAGPEFSSGLGQVLDLSKLVLGFDVQKDLLENLGSEVVVAQTAVDTSAPLSFLPGLTASIPLKDAKKVEFCLKKIGDALDRATESLEGAAKLAKVRLKRLEHHGKPIYYLTGQILAGPVAFAIVGNRMLVCSSYNAARRGIEQLEANTDILSNRDFQDTIARLTDKPFDAKALPASFAYSVDRGSGTGALLLAGLGLAWTTTYLAIAAELPGGKPNAVPNAVNANPIAIPENEKAAVFACRAFAEAEEIYHRTDYTGNGVLKYSPALKGDNSLLENKAGSGDLGLIDKSMGEAEGEPGGKPSKRGYRFKVLTGQGKSATGGARSYIVNGNMTLGYALVAYPSEYGVTGKKSFMINSNGITFSRDFGAGTADAVKALTAFDPDPTWTVSDEDAPPERLPAPEFTRDAGNEFVQFFTRPSGQTVLSIVNTIDLGLWPDEGFFMKYRRPTGAVAVSGADGIHWRSELPPPGPASSLGINPALIVSSIAVFAVIGARSEATAPVGIGTYVAPAPIRSRTASNETAAAAACKAYAEAQEIYRRTDYTGNGVHKYAPSLNALYEKTPGAGDIQMIDKTFVQADGTIQNPRPKAGYYFKVLTTQGEKAAGGKRNYVVNGNMILGYALVAWPATYDGTGRETFIINNNGTIYQKDMGQETDALAKAMTEYNPDDTWAPTQ